MISVPFRFRGAAFGLSILTVSSVAAGSSPQDAATAETLFREAKRLMAEEDFVAACPKLAASQRLDPALGTLLNLADCHENEGKLASAWAEFLQAAHDAGQAGREEAEKVARERAEALESRLTKLKVDLADGASVEGLAVKRNGQTVEIHSLGMATPIDAGVIQVEASAPGYISWSGEVEATTEGEEFSIEVPALEREPVPVEELEPEPEVEEVEDEPAEESSLTMDQPVTSNTQRQTWGWVGLGVGAVGMGIGGALGLVAMDRWNTADCDGEFCPDDEAQGHAEDARTFAAGSTVAFIAGGILAGTGLTLLLTAPKNSSKSAKRERSRTIATNVGPSGLTLSLTQEF